jgi:hypothetical protein
MKCEEFRQAATGDPAAEATGLAGHAGVCPDCRGYLDRLRALDRDMRAAMALDAPEATIPALPATADVVTMPRRASWARAGWIGLAASVALVAVFVVNRGEERLPGTSLAEQVIAHLDHEPASLAVTSTPVSDSRFRAVARPALVDVNRDIGLVTYAASCIINGREVPHLVVQGENGPVTLLLLPHETVARAIPLQGVAIEGLILPVGNGSVAIIGNRGESIDRWRERVAETIHWTA